MAQVSVEALDSRSLSNSGGRLTGSRTFHVWDDTTPMVEPSTMVFGTGGLPTYGELFPGETELFAGTFSIEPVPDSNYVWRITWSYTTGGGDGIDPEEVVPIVPGYVTFSMEYAGQFVDAWRADPGLLLWSSSYAGTDIAGAKIDAGGEPTSLFRPRHVLIVDETVTAASMVSRSIIVRQLVGTRNSATFYGASAGTLLYEGSNAKRVSQFAYSISHRFSYDGWLHAHQQPRMNQQRQPDCDIYNGQLQANNVRWIQPYGLTANFNGISEYF